MPRHGPKACVSRVCAQREIDARGDAGRPQARERVVDEAIERDRGGSTHRRDVQDCLSAARDASSSPQAVIRYFLGSPRMRFAWRKGRSALELLFLRCSLFSASSVARRPSTPRRPLDARRIRPSAARVIRPVTRAVTATIPSRAIRRSYAAKGLRPAMGLHSIAAFSSRRRPAAPIRASSDARDRRSVSRVPDPIHRTMGIRPSTAARPPWETTASLSIVARSEPLVTRGCHPYRQGEALVIGVPVLRTRAAAIRSSAASRLGGRH